MKKIASLALSSLVLLSLAATMPLAIYAAESSIHLTVVEWHGDENSGRAVVYAIPSTDNSMTNPDYKLLRYYWHTTIKYWVNPSNDYGLDTSVVVTTITASANIWDSATSYALFAYQTTTSKPAGVYDSFNVVAWGTYSKANVIAVTYIWYFGNTIVETDTIMNKAFAWSLSGESGKMDVQNIMTHEFGHWCGLADLYNNIDYWLTMYGYAGYGETYKRTLGLGDILGLQKRYGA